jgi:ribosome-interacting GTPase 1
LPTNLPPEAKAKWAEAQQAKDPLVKLKLLREFYSSFPKHKSTERLEMSIKRQMNKLEEEVERSKKRKTGSSRLEWYVRKEGMIQLAVVGPLSETVHFFNQLTNHAVKEFDLLLRPVTGVFVGASTQFQVVAAPYDEIISPEKQEQFLNLTRNVDGLIVLSTVHDPTYLTRMKDWFESHNIEIGSQRLKAEINQTSSGGIRIVGTSEGINERELVNFLAAYKIRNAVVKLSRSATLDDAEAAIFGRTVKPAVLITSSLKSVTHQSFLTKSEFSIGNGEIEFDKLAATVLKTLGKIRVFTKGIGEEPVRKPLIINNSSTVIDAAREIHKGLAQYFKYAKLWREGLPEGMRIGKSFLLQDGDIIEVHSS